MVKMSDADIIKQLIVMVRVYSELTKLAQDRAEEALRLLGQSIEQTKYWKGKVEVLDKYFKLN